MKTLKNILMVAVIGILFSCGTSKNRTNTTTQTDRVSEQQKSPSAIRNQTDAEMRNTSRTTSTNRNESTNRSNRDAVRNQKMFTNLGMNPNQIKQYESQWTKARNDFQKNNSERKKMNSFERTEHQDRIMKEILDDSQFVRYQQWVRDNPYDEVDKNRQKK